MKAKESDCYIDVWREADFGGARRRIYGPAEYPTLKFDTETWGDDIGSLRVGPHAFVLAYRDPDFKDKMIAFGPNDEVANLCDLKFDDEIDSLKVIDSLKIFDEVVGRAALRQSEGAASAHPPDSEPGHQPNRAKPKNRHKGRRR
ncbi:MAG TPA: hypothetical protein VFS10_03605 [Pyrinomonadaceae bacterium]|nr:hypothetical protein [Pyrinomonadaceae bacterium]